MCYSGEPFRTIIALLCDVVLQVKLSVFLGVKLTKEERTIVRNSIKSGRKTKVPPMILKPSWAFYDHCFVCDIHPTLTDSVLWHASTREIWNWNNLPVLLVIESGDKKESCQLFFFFWCRCVLLSKVQTELFWCNRLINLTRQLHIFS